MKRAFALVLTLALLLALAPAALAAEPDWSWDFPGVPFEDVPEDAWYLNELSVCLDYGLVSGTSDSTFSPGEHITLAQAAAFAARVYDLNDWDADETADFTQGDPWYQVYVDYCVEKDIFAAGEFDDLGRPATRREFSGLMARAAREDLEEPNTVEDGAVPDLATGSPYYDEIYTLYRAGVLTGKDELGTLAPDEPITRAEAVVIMARAALPDLRKSFMLTSEGRWNCVVGGIAFNVTAPFEDPGYGSFGYQSYLATEDGEEAAAIMFMTVPFLPGGDPEASKAALVEELRTRLPLFEDGAEPEITESTLLDLPLLSMDGSYVLDEEDPQSPKVLEHVDIVLNASAMTAVVISFGVTDTASGDYRAVYDDILASAVLAPAGDYTLRPELIEALGELQEYYADYQDFSARFEEAFRTQLPDLYAEYQDLTARSEELQALFEALEEDGLSSAEYLYLLSFLLSLEDGAGDTGGLPFDF